MILSGKEKRRLRAQGTHVSPEIWIGKEGVGSGTLVGLENSFRTKELVKIKILENCSMDKKEVARILGEKTRSHLVQILGRTLLFYRPLPGDIHETHGK